MQAIAGRSARLAVVAVGFALLVPLAALTPFAIAAEPGTSPLEQAAGAAASEVAGKPVQVRCHDTASWAAVTVERRVDPSVAGFARIADGLAELAPKTCAALDDLWAGSPPACTRQVPYTVTVRTSALVSMKKRVRVRVNGRLVWRTTTVRVRKVVTRRVQRERTVPAACSSQDERGESALTLAHEAVHLAGIRDEATAECWGVQHVAAVAERLGVSPADADLIALRAWTRYPRWRGTALWSAECRQDGALDLTPGDGLWP